MPVVKILLDPKSYPGWWFWPVYGLEGLDSNPRSIARYWIDLKDTGRIYAYAQALNL